MIKTTYMVITLTITPEVRVTTFIIPDDDSLCNYTCFMQVVDEYDGENYTMTLDELKGFKSNQPKEYVRLMRWEEIYSQVTKELFEVIIANHGNDMTEGTPLWGFNSCYR